jgi:uncharacterized protein
MYPIIRAKLLRLADHLIESPCIAVCKLDSAGKVCTGCYRTTDEIESWPSLDGAAKRNVIAASALRKSTAADFDAKKR